MNDILREDEKREKYREKKKAQVRFIPRPPLGKAPLHRSPRIPKLKRKPPPLPPRPNRFGEINHSLKTKKKYMINI